MRREATTLTPDDSHRKENVSPVVMPVERQSNVTDEKYVVKILNHYTMTYRYFIVIIHTYLYFETMTKFRQIKLHVEHTSSEKIDCERWGFPLILHN